MGEPCILDGYKQFPYGCDRRIEVPVKSQRIRLSVRLPPVTETSLKPPGTRLGAIETLTVVSGLWTGSIGSRSLDSRRDLIFCLVPWYALT